MQEAREFLESLGYEQHPVMDTSFLCGRDTVTIGPDRHLVQLTFNGDRKKYRERYQTILDKFRSMFDVSSYVLDYGSKLAGLSLEGLTKKK